MKSLRKGVLVFTKAGFFFSFVAYVAYVSYVGELCGWEERLWVGGNVISYVSKEDKINI